ncbi:MAG: hypothetical protein QM756_34125 [Polyangiaceae bacterium]
MKGPRGAAALESFALRVLDDQTRCAPSASSAAPEPTSAARRENLLESVLR